VTKGGRRRAGELRRVERLFIKETRRKDACQKESLCTTAPLQLSTTCSLHYNNSVCIKERRLCSVLLYNLFNFQLAIMPVTDAPSNFLEVRVRRAPPRPIRTAFSLKTEPFTHTSQRTRSDASFNNIIWRRRTAIALVADSEPDVGYKYDCRPLPPTFMRFL